jgi:hypothetical protein
MGRESKTGGRSVLELSFQPAYICTTSTQGPPSLSTSLTFHGGLKSLVQPPSLHLCSSSSRPSLTHTSLPPLSTHHLTSPQNDSPIPTHLPKPPPQPTPPSFAKSQRAQLFGQALGLPPFMALFSFVGLAVTSASVVIYGHPIVDPVELLGRIRQPAAICVALFGLVLATLTTNIAANVVRARGPALPACRFPSAGGSILAPACQPKRRLCFV